MEMFREIPSSSEARQVLSEEEMNRLLPDAKVRLARRQHAAVATRLRLDLARVDGVGFVRAVV